MRRCCLQNNGADQQNGYCTVRIYKAKMKKADSFAAAVFSGNNVSRQYLLSGGAVSNRGPYVNKCIGSV